MTPERWRLLQKVVADTLEIRPEDRELYLDSVCGEDAWLRSEAERILAGYTEAFLEDPPLLLEELIDEAAKARVFEPGEQVAGRFRIVRWLAHGGMGEVYEAEDSELPGVRIALKTVRGHIARSESLRRQFRREVELARKVTHPNVCRIYDLNRHRLPSKDGRDEETVVLSMELLEGETLSEHLRRKGALPIQEARPIAIAVIDALVAAHAAGIVHGDLKPNNVMLVGEGAARRPVVMDFGLAHTAQEGGIPAGAPGYMAPEQFSGTETTPATDIYALGVMLYEMMTGRHPFPGLHSFEQAAQAARTRPENPRSVAPDLDRRWAAAILKCLQPEPAQRFQSARELRGELEGEDRSTRRQILVGSAALLLSSAGTLAYRKIEASRQGALVAVLPFENAGGDPANRYFVEGLSDEIRDYLSQLPGLRVIARTSSAEVGRARMSFVSAGQKLSATHIVSGTGRRDGGIVRVTVRLIHAPDGLEIWRQEYSKPERDSLTARFEIAAAIAPVLGLRLRRELAGQLARGRTALEPVRPVQDED